MNSSELSGRTALVTGASSGLGIDFARELAQRGADLVLVARRQAQLEAVAAELGRDTGRSVRVMPTDLGDSGARTALAETLHTAGVHVDLLINNAGFGLYGDFTDTPWERTDAMLQVDVVALTHLTRLFLPAMIQRRWGRVLLVGSTASFQPSPTYAVYAAAKAYVLSFGVALRHELRGTGVSCTTVCPGVTRTEFLKVSGQQQNWFHRLTMMESATVAAIGIRALLAGRASRVTGWLNAMTAFSARLTPLTWAAAAAAQAMRT